MALVIEVLYDTKAKPMHSVFGLMALNGFRVGLQRKVSNIIVCVRITKQSKEEEHN